MRAIRVHEYGGPEAMRLEESARRPSPATVRPWSGSRRPASTSSTSTSAPGSTRAQLPLRSRPRRRGRRGGGGIRGHHGARRRPRRVDGRAGLLRDPQRVPADRLVALPAGVDARAGAAAMLQGMTAHYLAHSTYPLKPGDTCLVHAAAGGVGLLLCQMAKRAGARVIGTVSTEDKAKLAREAGAHDVILYTRQDFEAEVKRLTGGKGLQVVYDSVGRDTFEKGFNCLAPRGYMVLYGASSGPVAPARPPGAERQGLALPHAAEPLPLHRDARRPRAARRRGPRLDPEGRAEAPHRGDVPAGRGCAGAPGPRGAPDDREGAPASLTRQCGCAAPPVSSRAIRKG